MEIISVGLMVILYALFGVSTLTLLDQKYKIFNISSTDDNMYCGIFGLMWPLTFPVMALIYILNKLTKKDS